MGYAKSTFALAVYGVQDVFSSKLLYLKIWTSNNNPVVIGRWYLQYLNETKGKQLVVLYMYLYM